MAQEWQEGIPVWDKRITQGRRSGKKTSVAELHNSDWEAVSVKLAQVNSYQIIKELQCQGKTFGCFAGQQGTIVDSATNHRKKMF